MSANLLEICLSSRCFWNASVLSFLFLITNCSIFWGGWLKVKCLGNVTVRPCEIKASKGTRGTITHECFWSLTLNLPYSLSHNYDRLKRITMKYGFGEWQASSPVLTEPSGNRVLSLELSFFRYSIWNIRNLGFCPIHPLTLFKNSWSFLSSL